MKSRIAAALLLFSAFSLAQQTSDHNAGVVQRGDEVMGFSHDKTTHRFRLYKDGGSIEALANNPTDATSRDEIREHLQHIAGMFKSGDFNAPMLIHARTPPGVPTMNKLRDQIQYRVEETPNGARVRVSSENAKAVAAIHDFLRFQIQDHQTGDPTTISKE
ncbi:MAG TPA: hypothetical protein VNX88_06585 [Terriglobales bacterium]|jgi:hypothetical protein|nr:hypothetical protein [Terriglobales bacterium]